MNEDTYVKRYTKEDGTKVKNHFRTEANDTDSDNYTAIGNVNPYTGEKGTKQPTKDDESNTSDRDETQ
jgi:hypothetical protein